MNDSTTDKPAKQKAGCFKIGCLGMVIFAVLFVVLGLIVEFINPSVVIKRDTATIEFIVAGYMNVEYNSAMMAGEVYDTASKHPELKKIVINCTLDGATRSLNKEFDKYGNAIATSNSMGVIEITDLDDVRKYKDHSFYASDKVDFYFLQIKNLRYANLLPK